MFDIANYIEEIEAEKDAESSYEVGLPPYLAQSLKKYKEGLEKIKNKENYLRIDCDFCDLQADINCAEVDQRITAKQADYLRRTYLYDNEE